jgi:hypothetical protein
MRRSVFKIIWLVKNPDAGVGRVFFGGFKKGVLMLKRPICGDMTLNSQNWHNYCYLS